MTTGFGFGYCWARRVSWAGSTSRMVLLPSMTMYQLVAGVAFVKDVVPDVESDGFCSGEIRSRRCRVRRPGIGRRG
ncbi:hypothetical protein CKJ70_25220 [Mycobacterium avium]|nr:hypothetical protein CKJ70_25220 [Mycobacterium avium]